MTPVEAALDYTDYAADWRLALAGEELWASKFGQRAKGDDILGRLETETRPHACMRILAAEVRRLRAAAASAPVSLPPVR